jgi:outer membrane protein OmpA-like peptidoglycan-associated protein
VNWSFINWLSANFYFITAKNKVQPEDNMTQDELREAVLAALLDYETHKKTRRIKAIKKALHGTVMATVIGSTGIALAGQARTNQVKETAAITAITSNVIAANALLPEVANLHKVVPGAAFFGINQRSLEPVFEEPLMNLIKGLPKDAELTVIGCTDAKGGKLYNKKLGKQRAQAVANFLERHGVKVKAISYKISENMNSTWLARRVDIVVDSVSTPVANNLPPLVKQGTLQQSKAPAVSQVPINAVTYHDNVMQVLPKTEKAAVLENTKHAETNANVDSVPAFPKLDQDLVKHHIVTGVTHYALNGHSLASVHKERLMELIKQLPLDAELTVIGRTDSNGIQAYNKTLGKRRAKAVANFLASHGVKIKAVGTKDSSNKQTGWMARRVDLVVDSAQPTLSINLPGPVKQEPAHYVGIPPKPIAPLGTAVDGKRAVAIEKDVTRLIERARHIYNVD